MSPFDWKGTPPKTKPDHDRKTNAKRGKNVDLVYSKAHPVRVKNGEGVSHWYPTISAAARDCNLSITTVRAHLASGDPVKGLVFVVAGWER